MSPARTVLKCGQRRNRATDTRIFGRELFSLRLYVSNSCRGARGLVRTCMQDDAQLIHANNTLEIRCPARPRHGKRLTAGWLVVMFIPKFIDLLQDPGDDSRMSLVEPEHKEAKVRLHRRRKRPSPPGAFDIERRGHSLQRLRNLGLPAACYILCTWHWATTKTAFRFQMLATLIALISAETLSTEPLYTTRPACDPY